MIGEKNENKNTHSHKAHTNVHRRFDTEAGEQYLRMHDECIYRERSMKYTYWMNSEHTFIKARDTYERVSDETNRAPQQITSTITLFESKCPIPIHILISNNNKLIIKQQTHNIVLGSENDGDERIASTHSLRHFC